MNLESDFNLSSDNIDAGTLANTILQQKNVAKYLNDISDELSLLNDKIKNHVITKHDDLMSHAAGIEKLESVLDMMCSRTNNLAVHSEKITKKIEEPFNILSSRVHQLDNLQLTCDTVRKVIRINCLVNRLQEQKKDPSKASATINELKYLYKNTDWKGIRILEEHHDMIEDLGQSLIEEAWNLIKLFKDTNNQALLGVALQVFCSMDILTDSVNKIVADWQNSFSTELHQTIDIKALLQSSANKSGSSTKGPGRALLPSPGQSAALRAALWTMLDRLVAVVESHISAIILLSRTLHRKKDSGGSLQRFLIDCLQTTSLDPDSIQLDSFCRTIFLEDVANTAHQYQLWISEVLSKSFRDAITADSSHFLKQTIEAEYPKLLKLFNDLNLKLQSQLSGNSSPDTNARDRPRSNINETSLKYFRTFLVDFEQAFLSKSLQKLIDFVNSAFQKEEKILPTDEEVNSLMKLVVNELNVSAADMHLLTQSCKNTGKAVDLICARLEEQVCQDVDASQLVASTLTVSQKKNFRIVQLLMKLRHSLDTTVIRQLRLTDSNESMIRDKMEHCQKVQIIALQSLINNIKVSIERIMVTLHTEDLTASDKQNETSLMMKELQEFAVRVRSEYLNVVADERLLQSVLLPPLLEHAGQLLLLHVCLVRPLLATTAKCRIATDLDQFEGRVVATLLFRQQQQQQQVMPGPLALVLRKLRTMRTTLFQSIETLVDMYEQHRDTGSTANQLPRSLLLLHLFGRAAPELKSPYVAAGWSLDRYLAWLQQHPVEQERISFIRGGLEAYANQVRLQEKKHYAEEYVHMMAILDSIKKS